MVKSAGKTLWIPGLVIRTPKYSSSTPEIHFRCDTVPTLFEVQADADGQYPDEAISGITEDKDDRNYLTAKYVEDQPETIDMVYQWRTVLDDYQRIYGGNTSVLLIETYSPAWYTMQFYGNRTVNGAHLPFNFNFITVMEKSGLSAKNVQEAIDLWLLNMPAGRTPNWVVSSEVSFTKTLIHLLITGFSWVITINVEQQVDMA